MAADPVFLAGERLPAGKLQKLGGADTSWTPTIDAVTTDPTIGAGGVVAGDYYRRGDLCFFQANIIWGGAGLNVGVGSYRLTLPVALQVPTGLSQTMVGQGWAFDASGALTDVFLQHISGDSATLARMLSSTGVTVGPANPYAWATGDTMIMAGWYQAAW
jgi:hypothetical protein